MATNADKDMSEHLDKIRADIAALSETVKALAADTAGIQSSLGESLNKRAREAAKAGEKLAEDAAAMGTDAFHSAASQATDALKDLEGTVARKPMTSLLIALGVGFAFGLLSRR